MATLLSDLRYALRQLRRTPGFTMVALLTLAVGLGVNAAMFSLVSAVLFRPVQVEEPERLVRIYTSQWERSGIPSRFFGASSLPDFEDFQVALGDVFSGMAAYEQNSLDVVAGEASVRRLVGFVGGDFFGTFRPRVVLGRGLPPSGAGASEGTSGVVIGDELWRSQLDGDPGVLGRRVTIAGEPFTIVGVVSSSSLAPMHDQGVDLLLPMSAYERLFEATQMMQGRDNRWVHVIGRLRDGVPIERAQAALTTAGARISAEHPAESGGRAYTLRSARTMIGFAGESAEQVRTIALLTLGVAGIVLLIVCANVANLLLARASRRAREIAVRLALGAARARILRQLLTESLVLALLGSMLATLIAMWVPDAVRLLPLPAGILPAVDARVLAYTVMLATIAALIFGLAPALHGTRLGAAQTIQRAGGSTITARRSRLRSGLLVSQIALAFVLLVAAGLLTRTMRNMRHADPGFDVESVLVVHLDVDARRLNATAARAAYERVLERVAAVPGVERVALATAIPLGGGGVRSSVSIAGYEPTPLESMELPFNRIAGAYLETMGMPLVAGSALPPSSERETHVLINEALARRYWSGRDPRGSTIRYGDGPSLTVAGIVRDAHFASVTSPPQPMIFRPLETSHFAWSPALHVRAAGDPLAIAAAVRTVVTDAAPELTMLSVQPLAEIAASRAAPTRVAASAMGVFGGLALLLASIGLYGVMAFLVSIRTPEVGIRMALGADRRAVVQLFLREGARVVLAGVAIGTVLALGFTRVMTGSLYGVPSWDPATYLGIATMLIAVALVASWLPARRATAIAPTIALRTEGG